MNEFKFACPQCQQTLEATQEYVGAEITCPSCQNTIVVPSPMDAGARPRSKLTKAPTHSAAAPAAAATAPPAPPRRRRNPKIAKYIGYTLGTIAVVILAIIFVPKGLQKYHQHQADLAAAEALRNAPPPPPEPQAAEIMRSLSAAYKGMSALSLHGSTVATIDSSAINPAGPGVQTFTSSTSLRFGRPDYYRMEWERAAGGKQLSGAIFSAGKGDFVRNGTVNSKTKNRETALGFAAVNSGSLGTWIATLFYEENNSIAALLNNPNKTNNETLNGEKCYVLTGQVASQNVLIWVRKSDFLVQQSELILGGKVSDSTLAALPAAQRAQLERASKVRGSFIETYDSITTNQSLNPGDYETAVPLAPPATPKPPVKHAGGKKPRRQ